MTDYGMGDLFKKGFEFQQDMVKNWMNAVSGAAAAGASAKPSVEADSSPFASMNKMYQSIYENWQKQFTDNPWMKMQPWDYNLFSTSNPMTDIFNKMMNSGKSVTDLSAIWQQLQGKSPFTSREEILKFIEENKASYEKLAHDFISPFLPENLRPMIGNAMGLMKQYEVSGQDLLKPWTELAEKNAEATQRIMQGDTSAYGDFYKLLNKAYGESYGKLFNVSGMGLTKEQDEAMMAQLDSFYKLLLTMSELVALVTNVSRENTVKLIETYSKLGQEGKPPQSLKEFYDLWIKINEDAFIHVFGTPQFSQIFCEFFKKYCEFKIHVDSVLEKAFDWAPFPKNSEMVNLYKSVYELRKADFKNTQRITALEEELAALKGETKTAKRGDK